MRMPARLAAGVAFAALALGFIPSPMRAGFAAAQTQNVGQRVVNGMVLDADAAAIAGATVFLRNAKTKSIRSYTSTKDGHYRFAQVNMSEDYDLWAEKDGKKSATRTISSWDTRKEVDSDLKLK